MRDGTDKITIRSYHVPMPEIRNPVEKTKGEEPMTNENIHQEEQDLEISEETAKGVSGGVAAVQEQAAASAGKLPVIDPKLKAEL